jgi:cytochrome P460
MKILFCIVCLSMFVTSLPAETPQPERVADGPQYTADGQLKFPADYREWVFLSSGLGMTYGPAGAGASAENPPFDNVFVERAAYRAFLNSGQWPDKSVFVLEVRSSQSKGSINNGGHFQSDAMAVEVHVKDEKRFPGKWAFFGFDNGTKPAKQIPASASCYSCHAQHGAVDTTFVQFYPTLIQVAKEKGTYAK